MSELTFNLLRFGYLLLLWVFVLSAVAVLRRDISVRGHSSASRAEPEAAAPGAWVTPAPSAAPIGVPTSEVPIVPMPNLPGSNLSGQGVPGPNVPAPIVVGQPAAPIVVGPKKEPKFLSITSGALAGSMVPLTGLPITIGRAASNTLVLDDDYASGHHARVYPTPEGWVVEDLNSTNGTFIQGAQLTGAAILDVGVPVTIGHSVFKLVV